MARTSASRGAAAFKMRSGNSSTFKKMGSSSTGDTIDPTEVDIDKPYVREKGVTQPNIEDSTGVTEASKRSGTYNKPTDAEGSFSTPALDNLWSTIQKMEPGKKRDEGIEHYKKKREEMQEKLRKKN